MDPDAWVAEEPLPLGPGDREQQLALEALERLPRGWTQPSEPVRLGPKLAWLPDRVAKGNCALYLTLGGDLPRSFARRLEAAKAHGWSPAVAVATRHLELQVLLDLQRLDSRLVMLQFGEDDRVEASEYRSVADWIALEGITLSPADFRQLVGARLLAAQTELTNTKGRYFEEALCLFFNQVGWLRVEEHSFNNATEEIDIVLSVHATGDLAGLANGPLAIATAKNEKKPTNSQTVKYLNGQMANRNGRAKLGFLCSASTISSDARLEILRGSTTDSLIVELDRRAITKMIDDASSLSTALASEARKAAVA